MPGTCGSPIARGVMSVRVRIVTSSCWLVVGALVLALTIACGDESTDRIATSTPPSVDSTGKLIPTRTAVPTRTLSPTSATGPATDDEQPPANGIVTLIPTRTAVPTRTLLPTSATGPATDDEQPPANGIVTLIPTRTPVPTRTLSPNSATGPATDDEQPPANGIVTLIPTRTPVRTPTPLPSGITGATPIPTGGGQLHPPQLTTVAPQPASPGSQITVTGTGGYIKITGGYSEGSRQFHLYFDEQLIGTIRCMMNACRAAARIPEDATPGEHKLSAEGGSSITVTVE